MAELICFVRAFHSIPTISKWGWFTGSNSLNPRAEAIDSAIAGVISPNIELGIRMPIGPMIKSASPMETRMAFFSRGSAAGFGLHHPICRHRVRAQRQNLHIQRQLLAQLRHDLDTDSPTHAVYHCHDQRFLLRRSDPIAHSPAL